MLTQYNSKHQSQQIVNTVNEAGQGGQAQGFEPYNDPSSRTYSRQFYNAKQGGPPSHMLHET